MIEGKSDLSVGMAWAWDPKTARRKRQGARWTCMPLKVEKGDVLIEVLGVDFTEQLRTSRPT